MADINVKVQSISSANNAYGGQNVVASGHKQGELVTVRSKGTYAKALYDGNVFTTSLQAVLTIPQTLTTLASKFCLVNPASSNKYLEFIRADYFLNSATEVANDIAMTKGLAASANLTALTAGTINNCMAGGPNALGTQALFYTAATHADTPAYYRFLGSINATAVGKFYDSYLFDGSDGLYPGYYTDIVVTLGAQANSLVQLVWAEWPI